MTGPVNEILDFGFWISDFGFFQSAIRNPQSAMYK